MPRRCRVFLSDRHSIAELVAMRRIVESEPSNRMPAGSLYLYTPKARRKLDEIDRAIAEKSAEQRAAAGNPVPASGYSGRQTNRRR